MSFAALTAKLGQKASYAPPPDYVLAVRQAALLPSSTVGAHLYVETTNYDGSQVDVFLGTLEPKSARSTMSLDLAFGFGSAVTFRIESAGDAPKDKKAQPQVSM